MILGVTVGALAFDVTIGKKHVLERIEELFHRLHVDEPGFLELAVDAYRQLDVFRRMRGMPVVETQVKALQIPRAARRDIRHQLFGTHALGLGLQHDGSAVGIIGADKMHCVALHALEAHPDIRLDVLHDVADVKRPVSVRQRCSDEEVAGRGHEQLAWRKRQQKYATPSSG